MSILQYLGLLGPSALLLCVQSVPAFIAALPYLLNSPRPPKSSRRGLLGCGPLWLVGFAPVLMLAVMSSVDPSDLFAVGWICVAIGTGLGVIGPALVPGLRRRMILGVPLLVGLAYWTLIPVIFIGSGGMPVGIDAPLRIAGGLLGL